MKIYCIVGDDLDEIRRVGNSLFESLYNEPGPHKVVIIDQSDEADGLTSDDVMVAEDASNVILVGTQVDKWLEFMLSRFKIERVLRITCKSEAVAG